MTQILAVLWDSYELLTAKKLFWITLGLTILIALIYASIGTYDQGVSLLFGVIRWKDDLINAQASFADHFYMKIFTDRLVPWWLGFFSIVLALISTTPIFSNFLDKGSVDVAISKPVSRTTLFLTKYIGSLLFVAAQVAIFCVICYLAQGYRLAHWSPQIFLAVPLILLAFSSIYCVIVLTAVLTRSTIFSLLMGLVMWGVGTIINGAEEGAYNYAYSPLMEIMRQSENDGQSTHEIVQKISTPFPKIKRLKTLLQDEVKLNGEKPDGYLDAFLNAMGADRVESAFNIQARQRHSLTYIIGSTLAYNFGVLGLACFFFNRRDY